jgi:hypothetical protein
MASNKKILQEGEINLLRIISIIFNNKLKILLITTFAVLATFFYQNTKETNQSKYNESIYKVDTQIKPNIKIDNFEYTNFNFYLEKMYNKMKIDVINEKLFYNYFISIIKDMSVWSKAVKDFGLLKKEDYVDLKSYDEAVKNLVLKIYVIKSNKFDENNNDNSELNIQYVTNDPDQWKKFLEYFDKFLNNEVINKVQENYGKFFLSIKNLQKYEIEDNDIALENALINYDNKIKLKLAFLTEQALIARQFNIRENIIPKQILNIYSGLIDINLTRLADINLSNNSLIPYYMRGWNIIEKEIDLIKNKSDKIGFDQDIIRLEQKKRRLTSNKDIERLENLFKNTPLFTNSENLITGRIMVNLSKVKKINDVPPSNLNKMLILTGIISLILSVFYVLIVNELKFRKY